MQNFPKLVSENFAKTISIKTSKDNSIISILFRFFTIEFFQSYRGRKKGTEEKFFEAEA